MFSTLVELPNELLVKILTYLRPEDLNSLFGIPPFRERLQEIVSLVKDENESSILFPNIPYKSNCLILKDGGIPSSGLLELLEINSFDGFAEKLYNVQDKIPKMIVITDLIPRQRTDGMDDLDLVEDSLQRPEQSLVHEVHLQSQLVSRVIKMQNDLTNSIHHISFTNLFQVTLENVKVDPRSISLPNVRTIHFFNCTSGNENAFFDFPNLKKLEVTGTLHSLDKSFEYSAYPEVIDFQNVERWFRWNTRFGKLKKLMVQSLLNRTRCSINRCVFPLMREATFKSPQSTSLIDLIAPELTKLEISSEENGNILLEDIYAPEMLYMKISSRHLPQTKSLYLPGLEFVEANIEEVTARDSRQYELFESVPGILPGTNDSLPLLKKINTENIRYLCVSIESSGWSALKFPNLEKLQINLPDLVQRLPIIYAPNLKELVVKDCLSFSDLDSVLYLYPLLEVLIVDYNGELIDLTGLNLANMVVLDINTYADQVIISECCFPKLQKLSVQGISSSCDAVVDLEAPELLYLKLYNIRVDELSLMNTPKLQKLVATRVDNLYLGLMDSLIYLDLSGCILDTFEHQGLPNLQHCESYSSNAMDYLEDDYYLSDREKILKFKERYDPSLILDNELSTEGRSVGFMTAFFYKLRSDLYPS